MSDTENTENENNEPTSLADLFASLGITEKTGSNAVDSFVRDCFNSLNGGSDARSIIILCNADESLIEACASTPECESGEVLVVAAPEGADPTALEGRFNRRNTLNESKTRSKITYGALRVGVKLTDGENEYGLKLNRA